MSINDVLSFENYTRGRRATNSSPLSNSIPRNIGLHLHLHCILHLSPPLFFGGAHGSMNLCSFNSLCMPLMLPNMPLILFFNIRRTVEGYYEIFFSFILGKRAFMMLLMTHNSSQPSNPALRCWHPA